MIKIEWTKDEPKFTQGEVVMFNRPLHLKKKYFPLKKTPENLGADAGDIGVIWDYMFDNSKILIVKTYVRCQKKVMPIQVKVKDLVYLCNLKNNREREKTFTLTIDLGKLSIKPKKVKKLKKKKVAK